MPVFVAFNLTLDVPFPCPELSPSPLSADIIISYGETPETLDNPVSQGALFQAGEDRFLLTIRRVGRFLVQNGNEIIIQKFPEAVEDDIRLFLLGSCLGALLHQRGLLALHASAIETEKGAVLFCGGSGAGKSTLLGSFLKRGYRMLSDDITAVDVNGYAAPMVIPGCAQNKIWADSAGKLGIETHCHQRVRPQLEKFGILETESIAESPVPLYRIYELYPQVQPDIRLESVDNTDKFNLILSNTYRHRFMLGLGVRPTHFRQTAAASRAVKATRVFRPTRKFLLTELTDVIEKDFS